MKAKLLAILLAFGSVSAFAADIASVNVKSIEDELRKYYLSKPENAELKKRYALATEAEKKRDEEMAERLKDGGKSFDITSLVPKFTGAMDQYELEREIEAGLRKELYLIVSGLGLKYELIYDTSAPGAIIYAKSQVDDLTTVVRQAIIDLEKKPSVPPKRNVINRGTAPGG